MPAVQLRKATRFADQVLVGRTSELESIRSFLADADAGADDGTVALVLEGEPGIGKTALWSSALAGHDPASTVCWSRPSEAEASFSFAALGDLLATRPDDLLSSIPPPQRHALEVALMLRESPAPPPQVNVVAAGFLSAIRALAADGSPVLLAVDDLQWLDAASTTVLSFALRRVQPGERLRFLLSRRSAEASPADPTSTMLPERVRRIELGTLSLGAIQRLLAVRLGWRPPRRIAQRIHVAASGNPFYALELGKALLGAGGRLELSDELPVPKTLEALIGSQLDEVTEAGKRALLISALLADPAEAIVATAAGGHDAIDDGVAAGLLVRNDGRLRLAHPLFGSVLVARSAPSQRRAVHLQLAELTTEPEERARHLALGSVPPTERVAAQLEEAARVATAQGAASAAADLAEMAWRFTDPHDQPSRTRRLLDAANRHYRLGTVGQPEEMLRHDLALVPRGPDRARALMLLALRDPQRRFLPLLDEALQDADLPTRASILAEKAFWQAVEVRRVDEARAWAAEAVALARATTDDQLQTVCEGTLLWTDALLGRDVHCTQLPVDSPAVPVFDQFERLLAVRAIWRGELEQARAFLGTLLARAQAREEEWSLFIVTAHLVELELRIGNFVAAEEICDGLHVFGLPVTDPDAGISRFRAWIAAARGDRSRVRAEVEALHEPDRPRPRWQVIEATRARGFDALIAGEITDAVTQLSWVADTVAAEGVRDPGAFPVLPDLVEALIADGDLARARAELEQVEQLSREQSHPWGHAAAARCRGMLLVAEGDECSGEVALLESIGRFDRLELAFDRTRAQLDLGRLRRRQRRRAEARNLLQDAAASFDRLGCPPLATRAREELGRLGGRRPRPGLTPTETRVAELVAGGMSNAEVAKTLVVSTRAVEAHLTRIYAKLGIRSRTQLARQVLAGDAGG